VRIRNLKVFATFFIALVLLAVYGVALLRTYAFKPPPSNSSLPTAVASLEKA
jgi:hypothetical protein